MIIDSFTDKNAIDISKLAVPDVKAESFLTFDPERDITRTDWEKGLENFLDRRKVTLVSSGKQRRLLGGSTFMGLCRLGVSLKFLDPRIGDKLQLDDALFTVFRQEAARMDLEALEEKIKFAALVKQLFPGRVSELGEVFSRGDVMVKQLHDQWLSPSVAVSIHSLLTTFLAAKQWFPDRVFVPTKLLPEEIPRVREDIQKYSFYHWAGSAFDGPVQLASAAKLLYPESGEDLGLDRKFWRTMRGSLEFRRENEYWQLFFGLAYHLTILAADEAKITSDGRIAVQMHKLNSEMEEKIPDMPVKRAF